MGPKRLVLLVEGDGDVQVAPILVQSLLREYAAFDAIVPDPNPPFRVGEYSKIISNNFGEWQRLLLAAAKRKNCGACLLILDGDSSLKADGKAFCAMHAAFRLAEEAIKVGAGKVFSVAVVFACMEFESWLVPCANSFLNRSFSDGRNEFLKPVGQIPPDPEKAPRDAKGWFRKIMQTGYKPTRDQAEITKLAVADLNQIRSYSGLRSFQRLESAIKEIVAAIRDGKHIVSPVSCIE
jgi:hypothetical protein